MIFSEDYEGEQGDEDSQDCEGVFEQSQETEDRSQTESGRNIYPLT